MATPTERAEGFLKSVQGVVAQVGLMSVPERKAAIKRLHQAYAAAYFGYDKKGEVIDLDEAEVFKAFAEYIERYQGLELTTHEQIEKSFCGA